MANQLSVLAGWLIDGTGSPAGSKVHLGINNGIFTAVESGHPSFPANSTCLDLSDCTLLPPLIDSHVHLFMSGTDNMAQREHQLIAGYDQAATTIARHLHQHLQHGILAVRDGGDHGGYATFFAKGRATSALPFIKSSGKAWRQPGRYGKLIGRPPAAGYTLAKAIDYDHSGADQVKIVQSGLNSLQLYGKQTVSQFSLNELRQVVDLCTSKDKKVMVHCNGEVPTRIAIEAGCHSIEHGFFMGEDNLKRMADRATFWVPTTFTMAAYARHLAAAGDSKAEVANQNLQHQLEQLNLARKFGVPIAIGTDAGSIGVHHGEALAQEMRLLHQAGYQVEEVVQSATQNNARLLALDDFSTIKPGKTASFIAIQGGPQELLTTLDTIKAIYFRGESVSSK